MNIKISTDWGSIESELRYMIYSKIETLQNKSQILKMIDNIGHEVSELSRAEVEARQGKKHRAKELLIKVNQDIELVEEYLLVAALIG